MSEVTMCFCPWFHCSVRLWSMTFKQGNQHKCSPQIHTDWGLLHLTLWNGCILTPMTSFCHISSRWNHINVILLASYLLSSFANQSIGFRLTCMNVRCVMWYRSSSANQMFSKAMLAINHTVSVGRPCTNALRYRNTQYSSALCHHTWKFQ